MAGADTISVETKSPTPNEMLERARDFVPLLKDRAAEAERQRCVPGQTIQDLHDTGLWRINQPARVGGGEFDYRLLVEITSELARGCASTAWVYVNLAVHHWMLAMWPAAAQDRVWDEDPDALIASSVIYPAGRAEPSNGGFRLSGRWPFCSGIDHSAWVMLGASVAPQSDNQGPEPRMFLVPASALEVIDTWDVVGLAATGSKDVAVEDLFVASEMTLAARDTRGDVTPGSAVNPQPLYRQSVAALFPHLIAAVILGAAQDVLDMSVERLASSTSITNRSKIAEHATTQLRISDAGATIDGARLLMLSGFEESRHYAEAGIVPPVEDKLRWRRDGAHAARQAAQAANALYHGTGASAIFRSNPMQRQIRDLNAGLSHVHVSWDINGVSYGRVALGLAPDNPNI